MHFFEKQKIDETGKLAVKLEKAIFATLFIYFCHILITFVLTAAYRTSIIGPIFAFAGLLVIIGITGAYKRQHTMTCVYIGILAIELVIGLIGTVLYVVNGVVINSTTLQPIGGGPKQGSKVAVYLSVALAVTVPVVILINLYCLLQAAKLKMALKDEKKARKAADTDMHVRLLAEELIARELQLIAFSQSQPQQQSQPKSKKLKDKQVILPPVAEEAKIDIADPERPGHSNL